MTCQQLTDLVTDYLERTMPFVDRVRFRMHVGLCRSCWAYLDQMRVTVATLGVLPQERIPPAAEKEMLERFRHWTRTGSAPSDSININ